MSLDDTIRRRMLDDNIMSCIYSLNLIRSGRYTYDEKLKYLVELEKLFPDMRRLLIYFKNREIGN